MIYHSELKMKDSSLPHLLHIWIIHSLITCIQCICLSSDLICKSMFCVSSRFKARQVNDKYVLILQGFQQFHFKSAFCKFCHYTLILS